MALLEPRKRGRPKNKISKNPPRKLFKINQIIKLLGVTGRTIRYYDQVGLLPHVKRSDGGVRLFDERDIELIKKVRKLQKDGMYSLTEIKAQLFEHPDEDTDKWIVLTDSTASLPDDILSGLPIEVVSMKLQIGDEEVLDSKISPQKLWEKTQNLSFRPATAPPTESEFIARYKALAEAGYTKIYSIHISSTLSETVEIARKAAHKVSAIDISVIDSHSTGAGLGLFVKLIAQAIKNKESRQEIELLIEKQVHLIYNLVTVNTIKYLVGGEGLLSYQKLDAQKDLLKKLFEFKPIIRLANGSGDIEILECNKDKIEALRFMMDTLDSEIRARGGYVRSIMIIYNYMYGEAVELVNRVKTAYHNADVSLVEGSAVLSTYTGPETLGIAII
jgi:DegV family protein with EDD domain